MTNDFLSELQVPTVTSIMHGVKYQSARSDREEKRLSEMGSIFLAVKA